MPSPNYLNIKPDIIRTSKRTDRNQFKQYGASVPYTPIKPEALKVYERVSREDVIVSSCFDILIRAILSSVDRIIHDDDDIANFCNYILYHYEDINSTSWQSMLDSPIRTMLWGGASVSENIFSLDQYGAMVLEDLITYHPSTIYFYPDTNGRLTEGKPSYFSKLVKSGIYQAVSTPANAFAYVPATSVFSPHQKMLPRKKVIYLQQGGAFGNFYGQSSIAPIYRWVLLKEALIDMMAGALDRYGNPIFYIAMPDVNTSQIAEGEDGMPRALSTFETLRQQLAHLGSQGNALLLPYMSKDTEPKVGQISNNQNVGSVFINAIQYCNEQISIELGVPFFLLSGELQGKEKGETEHRMSIFFNRVEENRSKILNAICRQMFTKLIQFNFDGRPSAKLAPTFSRVYSDRAEDRVATMQVVSGLAKAGVLNPQEQTDFNLMRQMLGLPVRDLSKLDKNFFDLLYKKGGNTKGGGRPVGSVRPQDIARNKVMNKPTGDIEDNLM
jgi:hypothetical protein